METYQKQLGLLPPDRWLTERLRGVLPAAMYRQIETELAAHKRRYQRAGLLNGYATKVQSFDERGRFIPAAELAMMRAALANPQGFVDGEDL